MRELRLRGFATITGGGWQDTTYQDTDPGSVGGGGGVSDPSGGGGGSDPSGGGGGSDSTGGGEPPDDDEPMTSPAVYGPYVVLAPSADYAGSGDAAADLQSFFDALGNTVAGAEPHGPGNQNSGGESLEDYGPLNTFFLEMFGDLPHVQDMPEAHYYDYLTRDIDPEFLLSAVSGRSFSGSFRSGVEGAYSGVRFDAFDATHAAVLVNGVTYYGVFHSNASYPVPASSDPRDIIVYAPAYGYWTFNVTSSYAIPPGYVAGPNIAPTSPSSTPAVTYPPGWNAQLDHQIDSHAAHLAEIIASKRDADKREYSAFIWRDKNGILHESAVLPGSFKDTGNHTFADYGIPNSGKLVGFIHNHPLLTAELPNGNIDYNPDGSLNFSPNNRASYVSSGDIRGMQFQGSNTGGGYSVGGINYYRTYVVYNGVISKYDYIHNNGPMPDVDVAMPNAPKADFKP